MLLKLESTNWCHQVLFCSRSYYLYVWSFHCTNKIFSFRKSCRVLLVLSDLFPWQNSEAGVLWRNRYWLLNFLAWPLWRSFNFTIKQRDIKEISIFSVSWTWHSISALIMEVWRETDSSGQAYFCSSGVG